MPVSPIKMADAIRVLSMDAVHKAKSGHQGMPMGMADVATVLWSKFLKFDASKPDWADRDRFVLSAGHGSMLLYSLLHLTGFKAVTMKEIENFRQWGSLTPGHPEVHHTPGVETTTGPLGQGLATAVGMAMAEAHLAARFGHELVDHRTWVIAGDGCLMEGVSHEAISIAGRLRLKKLTVLFDDNNTTIDGEATISETGDQVARFKAAGWAVKVVDGHDHGKIAAALRWATKQDRPTMIACKTLISKGAGPKEGDPHSHGYTLFDDQIKAAREAMGWDAAPFTMPDDIAKAWKSVGRRGGKVRKAWEAKLAAAINASDFKRAMAGELPANAFEALDAHIAKALETKPVNATRVHSGSALDHLVPTIPEMIGGSADLTGSNNTLVKGMGAFDTPDYKGRYVHYGVREFGMAAAMNGMSLHGGVIPYSGTFLAFADYSRAAIRLGALMEARVIHVMTHDSIGLGEDGPTHQPVEHVASLRAIPNLLVFRPADAVEAAECWKVALQQTRTPSVMTLSRQKTPHVRAQGGDLSAKGAYELLAAEGGEAQVTIFASGTEVGVAVAARDILQAKGKPTRVVSTPCWELFDKQDAAYQAAVIGKAPVRVAVEAGIRMGWERFIGETGKFVGMKSFGASAPFEVLYQKFGITAEAVAEAALA
ncbi:transketolase [Caulobacter segnis]|uniref:Transketolase n=2 Tax=Caulobacter segnis TaxID=88688 RepID=D5VPU4_CAUST|nr:transketolase [Caulobacter segnis]ADG12517.1 transketolase [Caulobacter segnis ATCC 21756]AVQ04094.1 transketolase [Caulobacter segnis]